MPHQIITSALFLYLSAYCLLKKELTIYIYTFIFSIISILVIQAVYTQELYSNSSSIHAFMKISIGIFIAILLDNKFYIYFSKIILFLSILSIGCYVCNCFGTIIPYIPVQETTLDGGNVFRVSSILYTQLYNIHSHGLTLRNCGPFWEPGAFQGFLNLAILLETLCNSKRNKQWYLKIIIFSITTITTFSTGGYIALFLNLVLIISTEKKINPNTRLSIILLFIAFAIFMFFSIDFLGEKIISDKGRLGVSSNDLGDGMLLIFGYGFSDQSIKLSSIGSAGSLFNLIKYLGVVGLLIYCISIFQYPPTRYRVIFGIIVLTILMNEPFITTGPFWWSVPFITLGGKSKFSDDKTFV